MLAPGETVGSFEIEAQIGSGGVATVYRVRHASLGGLYALKVIDGVSEATVERLRTEGQAQASLGHPGIVRVHDLIETAGGLALVMDLVDGPDLGSWLRANHPVPFETVERLFREICEAVQVAHDAGIVHRDLKPANILLVQGRDGWSARLTDLGIARVEREVGQTRQDVVLGTPVYMAPEQLRDSRTVDGRADVWALGCTLYELVCGRTPLGPDDDLIALYSAAAAKDWPDARSLRPDLPEAIERTIDAALQPSLDRRPESARALLAVLDGRVVPELSPDTWADDPLSDPAVVEPTRPITQPPPDLGWAEAPRPDIPEQPIEPPVLWDEKSGVLQEQAAEPSQLRAGLTLPVQLICAVGLLGSLWVLLSYTATFQAGAGYVASVGVWPWLTFRAHPGVGGGFAFDPTTPSTIALGVYVAATEILCAVERRGQSMLVARAILYGLLVFGMAAAAGFTLLYTPPFL